MKASESTLFSFVCRTLLCLAFAATAHADDAATPAKTLPTKKTQATTLGGPEVAPPAAPAAAPSASAAANKSPVNASAIESDMQDPTLMNVYSAELYEIKKTEQAERDAVLARDKTAQSQADYEQQIALHRRKLAELKRKQEQINGDIQIMQAEVLEYQKKYDLVKGEYSDRELKHEDFLGQLDKERASLEDLKAKYEAAAEILAQRHDATKRNIGVAMAQINRIKAELAQAATINESMQAQAEASAADEMKAKAEWMSLKSQVEDMKAEKAKQVALRDEAEKKYEAAVSLQKAAAAEFAVAQRSLAETTKKTADEVRRLDESTLIAQRTRTQNEANRIKAQAETEKLQNYVALVKKSNFDVIAAERESDTNLMTTQMALDAARSELGMNVAVGDQMMIRKTKQASQARSVASIETADAILPGARPWTIKTNCEIHQRPGSAYQSVGEVTAGQRIPASVGPGKWIKVLSTGKTAYVRTECGSFD